MSMLEYQSEIKHSGQCEGGRNNKWYQKMTQILCCKSKQIQPESTNINPYALYQYEDLSPRSSSWVYLAASSLTGLAALLVVEQPLGNDENQRSSQDTLLLSILSVSLIVSLIIAISYRHRKLRDTLTKDILPQASLECISSMLLFILWCIVMRYVMDPFSGVEYGLTITNEKWGQHYYNDVWNSNLWISSWVGWGLSASLLGELMMTTEKMRRGVVKKRDTDLMLNFVPRSDGASNTNGIHYMRTYLLDEDGSKHWFLLLVTSCALSAYCIDDRSGVSCQGALSSTTFCSLTVLGATTGSVTAVISVCGLILHYINQRGASNEHKKLWCSEALCSVFSLVLNCINVSFVTSPGGPGTEIGNVFVSSWLGVIISLILCLRVEGGWTLRLIEPKDEEDDSYRRQLVLNSDDDSGVEYSKEKYNKKHKNYDTTDVEMGRRSPRGRRSQRRYRERSSSRSSGPSSSSRSRSRSKSWGQKRRSKRRLVSSHSIDSSGSGNMSGYIPKRRDTSSLERNEASLSSDFRTASNYSLPSPAPIFLDSSSDEHNLSRPSISLNSINGGQTTTQWKSGTTFSGPPPPPYNAHGLNDGLDTYKKYQSELSGKEDDDTSAIVITADQPDDVSALGFSMMSIPSYSPTVDPDGYKLEDNYENEYILKDNTATSPLRIKPNVQLSVRKQMHRLSSVEEVSKDDQPGSADFVSSVTVDESVSENMKIGDKLSKEHFHIVEDRRDSGSVGPITVDESIAPTVGKE